MEAMKTSAEDSTKGGNMLLKSTRSTLQEPNYFRRRAEKAKKLKTEIKELERQMHRSGGKYGGWSEEDHNTFLLAFNRSSLAMRSMVQDMEKQASKAKLPLSFLNPSSTNFRGLHKILLLKSESDVR